LAYTLVTNLFGCTRRLRSKEERKEREETAPTVSEPEPAASSDSAATAPVADGTAPGERPKKRRPRRRQGRRSGKKPLPETPLEAGPVETPEESREPEAAEPWDIDQFQVEPEEGKTRFHDLDLPAPILHGIADAEFRYCTPIQAALLPHTLNGLDAAGRAQTGTGKTAVFIITMLTQFLRNPAPEGRRKGTPRALVLAPTRELALQIEKETHLLSRHTPFKSVAIFGGMDYEKQKRRLTGEVIDIVVATPGRLLDFKRQGDLHLSKVEILVIDEADRMLDMGFIPDVQRIIHYTPPKAQRQTMLFSATLTAEVTRFASQWTRNPVTVEIEPEQVAVDTVNQRVLITTIDEKFTLLFNMITRQNLDRVIVFTNRRDQARKLTERLGSYDISCALLSGEVDQKKRVKTLEEFRNGKIRVLVATDVAARGLHVEAVSHVFNYNMPMDPEDYVHRIGRTGRAGTSGISVSFASEDDSFLIPALEKYLGHEIHCEHPDEDMLEPLPEPTHTPVAAERPRRSGPYRGRNPRSTGRRKTG